MKLFCALCICLILVSTPLGVKSSIPATTRPKGFAYIDKCELKQSDDILIMVCHLDTGARGIVTWNGLTNAQASDMFRAIIEVVTLSNHYALGIDQVVSTFNGSKYYAINTVEAMGCMVLYAGDVNFVFKCVLDGIKIGVLI